MRRTAVAAALLLSSLLAAPGSADPRSFGRVTTLEMPRGSKAESVLIEDVSGDGARDLVIAASRGGARGGRMLFVHLRRRGATAFAPAPDMEFDLLPDVVGIAVADVHADPGAEIVLLTPTGAFALRPRADGERDRYVELVRAEFLWQLPHDRRTLTWQEGVRDIDGDGAADLILPEPGGYTVALQRRGADGQRAFTAYTLRLPPEGSHAQVRRPTGRAAARARRRRMQVSIGVGSAGPPADLVHVDEMVPAPRFVDWDGDGRVDLLAQTTDELLVWRQGVAGALGADPDVRVPLPLEVDRRRLLDVSYAAQTADLDGDRRADYLLVAGDQDSDDPRAQVAVYRRGRGAEEAAHPLFGPKGLPAQLLVVAGIAGNPRLVDVDGDGLLDLVMGSARLDALDALRMVSGGTVDVEMYVYLNHRGSFSRRPDLTWEISVSARALRSARRSLSARFVGDATGDGVAELLLRDDPERVRLLMVRRAGDGLTVVKRPLFETAVDEDAEMVLVPGERGRPPEILLFTDRNLLFVEFGR